MKLKRIMAIILCIAMVFSTMSFSAFAEEATTVSDAAGLVAALISDQESIEITLANDIEVPMSSFGEQTPGSGEYKLGGENTKSIIIDLNTHKLTITTGYMSAIGAWNDDATITIKNGSMNSTGNYATTWNINDLMFANCNYEFKNVIFDKEVALTNTGKNVTMKDVTINGTGDYYALWIQAEGQNVTIDGLTISTPGRGIKIDEQYSEENVAKVTLDVSNATFTTAKKAAIMVKSTKGADITTNTVDISGVAADTENIVWVDEDSKEYQELVTINGEDAFVEGTIEINNIDDLKVFRDDVNAGNTYEGKTVKLTAGIDLADENWTPIGNDTNYFMGSFDGGNHTISNMTININTPDSNVFAGLFGGIKKATVKNLTMTDVDIDAVGEKVRAAAVVGIANCSENRTDATINFENITVNGCSIDATATSGSALLGGVVGYSYPANMSKITVSDLTINGKAEGNEVRAAAINGYVCGQNISNNGGTRAPMLVDTFEVSNATINAEGYTVFAGGYAPYTYYGYITLKDGNIDGLKITADAHEAFVGGLVGYFWRSDNGHTVENVDITDIDFDVTTDYLGETRIGGVVGTSQSPNTKYNDVTVSGNIVERCSDSANPVNYHAKVGGFVARTYEYAQQTYTNCVADVDVTGTNVVGGFVGNHNSTVSYVNCEAKGDVTGDISGGFAGRLTEHGYTTAVTFDNCKASGNVTGTNVAGGLIGSTVNHGWAAWEAGNGTPYAKTVTLVDCEASGTVTSGTDYCAGVVGEAVMKDGVDLILDNVAHSVDPAFYPTGTNVTVKTKVAQVGGEKFECLAVAIAAAQPNDTIILLAGVEENVTIDKSITIDGANKNYTGTMTLNAANITVQNVNFVGGNIIKGRGTVNGANITITNCDFVGDSDNDGTGTDAYAIEIRGSNNIVIENCTCEDYFGFLQVPSTNDKTSIKDVKIDGTSYAIKVDYSNGVTLENVTVTNSTYGFVNSNFGTKTIAVKNSTIKADSPLVIWDRDTKQVNTFNFEGNNDFGTNELYYNKVTEDEKDYTKYVLSKDATLTAVKGLIVTSSNEAYDVIYDNNTYQVAKTVKVGDDLYYSLQEAIDAADNGATITVLADIKAAQNVKINKNVVIDLNRNTLHGAILPDSTGDITVKNGSIKNADNNHSAIEINEGKLNLTNVNIESARHAVRIDGDVEAVIDGGVYKVVPIDGKTVHAVNASGNANVVIKNGEFIGPKGTIADSGAAVNVQDGSKVTIEGGTFTGGKNNTLAAKGTLTIYGGIFDQDPSAYVAVGYKISDKANKFYVVYPEFKVSAIVNDADKTVKAGEKFEVTIVVNGGDYTNAGWKLGYDPTKVEYVKAQGDIEAVDYAIVDSVLGEGETNGNEWKDGEVYKKYTFRAKYPSTTVTSIFTIENAYVNNYEMAAWLDKTPAAMEGDAVTITNDLTFGGTIADKEVPYNGMYQKAEEFVANMTGAEVTYSTEENGKYTTEVPSFKDAGEHTYYYKATLAGYTAVTGSAKLTITPATLAPNAEFNVDPDYDTVSVKAVLENLIDDSFKGTVTIEVDGEKVTFEASEFSYDGNGKAVAKQFKKIDLEEGKEYPVKVTYTANTAGDNYANAEGETKVNPDKKEITSDDLNKIKAALTNSYVYDGAKHYVKVDEANLPGEWKVEIPEIGLTDVGETMVTIKATDASGKYNEHTFNVVLKVTPKDITIVINNASKDLGQADPVFTSNIDELLVAANHLGEVKYVREPGEAIGTYKINMTYTPNPNYNVVDIVEGNLYIGAPTDFKVEVVNNKLLKGDGYKQDYIAGYRLVLVYTNVDKAYFTYKGQEMYDVSDAPYEYYDYDFATMTATKDNTEYKHIYAIVVEAEYGYEDTEENEAMYANNVEFASETAKPEKILYNSDINYTGELDVEDFSITNGVYNVLYRGNTFITRLLKADVNGNKLVDTEDARMIKEVVVK